MDAVLGARAEALADPELNKRFLAPQAYKADVSDTNTSGQITVANGTLLDYETATSHSVTVRVTDATGSQLAPYSAMCLAAMRGEPTAAEKLIEATHRDALAKGEGISIAVAEWTRAILHNGQGKYAEATAAARQNGTGLRP